MKDLELFKCYEIGALLKECGYNFSCDMTAMCGEEDSCEQCMQCYGYDVEDCSEILREHLEDYGYSYIQISETHIILVGYTDSPKDCKEIFDVCSSCSCKDEEVIYHLFTRKETQDGK